MLENVPSPPLKPVRPAQPSKQPTRLLKAKNIENKDKPGKTKVMFNNTDKGYPIRLKFVPYNSTALKLLSTA